MHRSLVLASSLLALTTVPLRAHDFWLAVSPWSPAMRLTITAHSGERFPGGADFTPPERVLRWSLIGADGLISTDAFRREGNALAADAELPRPGAYLATMAIQPRVTEMNGLLFTSYLHEEGLEWVVAEREAEGLSGDVARERFARYAKVAVRNGPGPATHLLQAVGFPAEFVPMTDPTLLRPGQLLTMQLLANGKPVAGAAVTALSETGGHPLKGRTDSRGHLTLPITRSGAWLVRTVHMVRGVEAGAPDVDWDSYWATFSFHTAAQ